MILEEFLKVFEIDAEIDLESDTRKEYHGKIVDLIDSKDFKKFKNLFVIDVCLMIQFEKIKDVLVSRVTGDSPVDVNELITDAVNESNLDAMPIFPLSFFCNLQLFV